MRYILAIDQSTQSTKGMLFDEKGQLIARADCPHQQHIDERGWVEHDPEEIYQCTIKSVREVLNKASISPQQVVSAGISNQRETAMIWSRKSGKPIYNAIVWQCPRGEKICEQLAPYSLLVQEHTGLRLSPYFSAAKLSWIIQNVDGAKQKMLASELYCGTIDSWLIYRLTGNFYTDFSNAARTQLFNIYQLGWDKELCHLFGISIDSLPRLMDSDALFGISDFEGVFSRPIPIHAVLGDSNGALFGQGCLSSGMAKATYGTGSSVMLHVGEKTIRSYELSSSIAWSRNGNAQYVLEGNINYTGSVISWLKNNLKLIDSYKDAHTLPLKADPADHTFFVPAFTGLGAPYWKSGATGLFTGITRTTGRAELVKAAVDCTAYQIADIIFLLRKQSGMPITELRVDGGPTENKYLMQLQSDIAGAEILVSSIQELSAKGVAYLAGIASGIYDENTIFGGEHYTTFHRLLPETVCQRLYSRWKDAVNRTLIEI